jgi:hypothetical protein
MQIVQTDYKHTLPSIAYIFVKAKKKSIIKIIILKMRQNGRQEY